MTKLFNNKNKKKHQSTINTHNQSNTYTHLQTDKHNDQEPQNQKKQVIKINYVKLNDKIELNN